jgi:hypothetical protein
MRCDEARRRILDGEPLDADLRAHASSCAECRDEVGFVALMPMPEPPAHLRDRVLSAVPRRGAWRIPAVAASVALALGLGFAVGRAFRPPAQTVVVQVPVDRIVEKIVEKPIDDREVFALAVSLQTVYGKQVNCEFDGMHCKRITADSAVKKMVPYCPLAQGLERVSKERPELVVYR